MSKRHSQPDSNTYRFFVAPDAIQDRMVQIEDAALAKQLGAVLRLGVGDIITVLDNSGWEYSVMLESVDQRSVTGTVITKTLAQTEPHLELTLYVALMRAERFEWVLQKGTELGGAAFVPVVCERSMVDDAAQIKGTKRERWQRIIKEAAEQSRRARLPRLEPALPFATACEQAAQQSLALLLWEGTGAQRLASLFPRRDSSASTSDPAPLRVGIISGPEGGWSDTEVGTAQRYGVQLATLGPRTLRAETAPVAATVAILFAVGDM